MLESQFQRDLIENLNELFPGCIILKNDPNYIQGIPDLIILYKKRWAALEVKRAMHATSRPNQEWYIDLMNHMSYASFVYPENVEEVLDALQQTFRTRRPARVS